MKARHLVDLESSEVWSRDHRNGMFSTMINYISVSFMLWKEAECEYIFFWFNLCRTGWRTRRVRRGIGGRNAKIDKKNNNVTKHSLIMFKVTWNIIGSSQKKSEWFIWSRFFIISS